MLSVIKDVNTYELKDELWSGALDTLEAITHDNKLQELMDILQEMYPEPVDITTINDLLWFDDEFVFEQLNIEVEDYTCKKS